MTKVNVKATPVNSLIAFVEGELDIERVESIRASFSEDERQFLSGHMLAHEMAPLDIINQFCVRAAEQKKEPVREFARRAGRFGAEQGINSVYRFVMIVLSPQAVLKQAPLMWSRVYDAGKLVVNSTDNSAELRLASFPSHVAGCARITGWFEVLGAKAGARNLAVSHTACIAEGKSECIWKVDWE